MIDLMSVIKGRRSIRRFKESEVPESSIREILESIRWSPSWANTQCWEVVIVRDKDVKQALKDAVGSGNPGSKGLLEAPVILVLCGKRKSSGFYKGQATTKFGDWLLFDLGLAAQSLCLSAYNLGLGTVIIGMLDHDKAKKVLGVGEDYEVAAFIPLGYPARESSAPGRREIAEFTHNDKF